MLLLLEYPSQSWIPFLRLPCVSLLWREAFDCPLKTGLSALSFPPGRRRPLPFPLPCWIFTGFDLSFILTISFTLFLPFAMFCYFFFLLLYEMQFFNPFSDPRCSRRQTQESCSLGCQWVFLVLRVGTLSNFEPRTSSQFGDRISSRVVNASKMPLKERERKKAGGEKMPLKQQ